MSGFIDAECPKCGASISWFGRFVDRPPCKKCGHVVPKADLEASDLRMDASWTGSICERAVREDKEWRDDQPVASKCYAEGQVAAAAHGAIGKPGKFMPLEIPSPYVATKTTDGKCWTVHHRWWLRGWYDATRGESRLAGGGA